MRKPLKSFFIAALIALIYLFVGNLAILNDTDHSGPLVALLLPILFAYMAFSLQEEPIALLLSQLVIGLLVTLVLWPLVWIVRKLLQMVRRQSSQT